MSAKFINPLSPDEYEARMKPKKADVRGVYFRDQTAIIHSLPFRRLKHKTQVFFSPNDDHICTRIEHSLHVATIAATIAKGLGLNDQLAYAIGLAHDLGHAPFGHAGETVLNKKAKDVGGFVHEVHGLRVVDILGNRGKGLNLSYAVRDGIICHCGEYPDKELKPRSSKLDLTLIKKKGTTPCSHEGCITRLSDKIAYLGRDLEDALTAGFVERDSVPKVVERELGHTNGEIIDSLVVDVIDTSSKKGIISLSDLKYNVIQELYEFSVAHIYKDPAILHYGTYCERIIDRLFDYLLELFNKWAWNISKYSSSLGPLDNRFGNFLRNMKNVYEAEGASPKEVVRDYVAGMTDSYALRCMRDISLPEELKFDKLISAKR